MFWFRDVFVSWIWNNCRVRAAKTDTCRASCVRAVTVILETARAPRGCLVKLTEKHEAKRIACRDALLRMPRMQSSVSASEPPRLVLLHSEKPLAFTEAGSVNAWCQCTHSLHRSPEPRSHGQQQRWHEIDSSNRDLVYFDAVGSRSTFCGLTDTSSSV